MPLKKLKAETPVEKMNSKQCLIFVNDYIAFIRDWLYRYKYPTFQPQNLFNLVTLNAYTELYLIKSTIFCTR